MKILNESYRVLICKEPDPQFGGILTAQILERDIGAQGKDIKELLERLLLTIQLEYEVDNLLKIERAPDNFFQKYEYLPDGVELVFENDEVKLIFKLKKDFNNELK